jgi:pyruvate dehydrogenase E1 component alpha subunit
MSLSRETLINLYRAMVRIRKFEEASRKLSRERKIPGGVSLYTGEEAIAAGVCTHLTKEDYLTSTHRPLGHCIAKGADLKRLMAEICAKATGYNKGKAGPYHVADPSIGLIGANGIVGGGVPMAAGYALAAQLKGSDRVAVCFYGEGASNQGVIQETLNLAAVWGLPLIFVCENSAPEGPQMLGHMMNYPQLSIEDISVRGSAYNIPGLKVDGSDTLAVYEVAGAAVARARRGDGPTLLECKTYQYRGPFRGENAAQLEEEWQKKDPILKFRGVLLKGNSIGEKDLDRVQKEEEMAVEEAVRFAEESPEPSLEEAFTDVFAKEEKA